MLGAVACVSQAALFDVTALDVSGGTASGTSNGVGFNFTGSLWGARTTMNDDYQGFTGPNFSIPMPNSDRLHTGGVTTQFVFDATIQSALVYLSDDTDGNYTNFFDFGVAASVVSGDVSVSGTAFRVTAPAGGIVRLTGINSNTLTSAAIGDGNDFAIVVETVPEPATMTILGLAGLAALARRRAKA